MVEIVNLFIFLGLQVFQNILPDPSGVFDFNYLPCAVRDYLFVGSGIGNRGFCGSALLSVDLFLVPKTPHVVIFEQPGS